MRAWRAWGAVIKERVVAPVWLDVTLTHPSAFFAPRSNEKPQEEGEGETATMRTRDRGNRTAHFYVL